MNILKDPIILGISTATICYVYLKISRQHTENNEEQEPISFKYPILLGIVVFLGMTIWTNNKSVQMTQKPIPTIIPIQRVNNIQSIGDALPRVFLEAI